LYTVWLKEKIDSGHLADSITDEAASLQLVIMEDDSSSDELQSLSDTSLASSLADSGESGGVMRMGA
jgi:hypothetical protein